MRTTNMLTKEEAINYLQNFILNHAHFKIELMPINDVLGYLKQQPEHPVKHKIEYFNLSYGLNNYLAARYDQEVFILEFFKKDEPQWRKLPPIPLPLS